MIISTNRKANFEYYIISTFEAGIVLVGSEVKSVRAGHTNLKDSFITFSKNGEAFIKNMHISEYKDAHFDKVDEKRSRKLLLNKHEIKKLQQKAKITLVSATSIIEGGAHDVIPKNDKFYNVK